MMVVAVVTQGRNGQWGNHWITKYAVEIKTTVNCSWVRVTPSGSNSSGSNFDGNSNKTEQVIGWFKTPTRAQVVRTLPLEVVGAVAMRAGLLVNAAAAGAAGADCELGPPLRQFAQVNPDADGYLYTIKGHRDYNQRNRYLTLLVLPGMNVVFMSPVNHANPLQNTSGQLVGGNGRMQFPSTSQWHLKWHLGMVRMVARGTRTSTSDGLALFKDGNLLTCRWTDGYNQNF